MEKKEQKHLYADTVEQNKRANHFLVIGYIVFYLCVLCVVGIACLRGIRTVGYTVIDRGIDYSGNSGNTRVVSAEKR